MLKRFLPLLLAAAVFAPALSFAQGLSGSGTTVGTYRLGWRKTGAFSSTSTNKPTYTVSVAGVATVAYWYSDSASTEASGAASRADTLTSFSRSDLEDWTIYHTTATSLAADSLWMFTLIVRPNSAAITVSADSIRYYVDYSLDGGASWQVGQGAVDVLEIGSANAFQIAFNLVPGFQGSDNTVTQTQLTFMGLDPLVRIRMISDLGGRYVAELKYPKALR